MDIKIMRTETMVSSGEGGTKVWKKDEQIVMVKFRFHHRRTNAFFFSYRALEWLLIYFHSRCFFLNHFAGSRFHLRLDLVVIGFAFDSVPLFNWWARVFCSSFFGECKFCTMYTASACCSHPFFSFFNEAMLQMRCCHRELCVCVWVAVRILFAVVVDVYTPLPPPPPFSLARLVQNCSKKTV